MYFKYVIIYGVIPGFVGSALIIMYYSGIKLFQEIVAPTIYNFSAGSWREFGLLENLQNLFLIAIIGMAIFGLKSKLYRLEKLVMAALAFLACFILMEETDYGLHFYEYFVVGYQKHSTKPTNIHNIGEINDILKQLCYIFLILFFFFGPLILPKINKPFIRYILPNRWFVLTLTVMFFLSRLAHYLDDADFNPQGNLSKNISEFEELTFYYIFMIYVYNLIFRHAYQPGNLKALNDTDRNK
jgi:hypothetical protein